MLQTSCSWGCASQRNALLHVGLLRRDVGSSCHSSSRLTRSSLLAAAAGAEAAWVASRATLNWMPALTQSGCCLLRLSHSSALWTAWVWEQARMTCSLIIGGSVQTYALGWHVRPQTCTLGA